MSFGRNPTPGLTMDHSSSSDQSTPRQFGFGLSQQSQSPVYADGNANSGHCYEADSPRGHGYVEPEQPLYSELYERLIAETRHRAFHNKRDDPSNRDQCGSGVAPYAVSPHSTNACLGDPEGQRGFGSPDEEIYEYDGDAILQHYSDLSSLHSNEGYSDAQSYAQRIRHPTSIEPNTRFTSSPFTTSLLYQGLTVGGSHGPDENMNTEQVSAGQYSQPEYFPIHSETPPNDIHGGAYPPSVPTPTYDIAQHTAAPFHPHSQHRPVPHTHHSSYSELSANVAFILGMTSQTAAKVPKATPPNALPTSPARATGYRYPNAAGFITPEPQSPLHPEGRSLAVKVKGWKPADGKEYELLDTSPPTTPTTPTQNDYTGKRGPLKRRPSLACFFCRERKIACGRPAEGSVDPTCNQCARRSYPCEYPTESLRGQHRRGRKRVHAHTV